MAQLEVGDLSETDLEPGYLAPYCSAHGNVSSFLFAPRNYSLWAVSAKLAGGARLEWETKHGDEAIFVKNGSLISGNERIGEGGVFIVEADVPAILQAEVETDLYHFGPTSPNQPMAGILGPPETSGHGVHVLPRAGAYVRQREDLSSYTNVFADSQCERCRINLFLLSDIEPHRPFSHMHSEDEIILVVDGEVRVGPIALTPGMCVAIPREHRYGYTTSGPYSFLNYRADVSTVTGLPGTEATREFLRPAGVVY